MSVSWTNASTCKLPAFDYANQSRIGKLLLSFNVKLFSQLLQVFATELQRIKKLVASSQMEEDEKLTPAVRHLLPLLRQYSSWLLADTPELVDAQTDHSKAYPSREALAGDIQRLWQGYVEMLDLLALTYSPKDLKELEYLLAEDEDALGFKPFADESVRKSRYLDDTGKPKPLYTDPIIQRRGPRDEMLHRIRGLLKDGMTIAKSTVSTAVQDLPSLTVLSRIQSVRYQSSLLTAVLSVHSRRSQQRNPR